MATRRRFFQALFPLSFLALGPMSCTCDGDPTPPAPLALLPCRAQTAAELPAPSVDPAATKIVPGATNASFAASSSGDATVLIGLEVVKGRGGVEPTLALAYSSSGGDGDLGMGFSLVGPSAITRCPQNLAYDGELRDVRFDAKDKLCLDQRRLVQVGEAAGVLEYRTIPDTFVKVIGHFPDGAAEKSPNNATYFEALAPSGLVTEYGKGPGGKPLARGGVPRAFLATKIYDGRGNTMTNSYCFANREDYTAEYAITEIRYTSFEGSPAREPSRAVRFLNGLKDQADIRIHYAGGMALQSSIRINEIQMMGPGDALVRRYPFTYEQSPTTRRTLLKQIQECGADGACKPPTRFFYKTDPAGFKRITTDILAPTSDRASPMLFDVDGDSLDDIIIPDTNPVISTPDHPITEWHVARNRGPAASPPYFESPKLAFSQEWDIVADPAGPADASQIQPELGTVVDYDQDGRPDLLLHDVWGAKVNETVLVTQPDLTFKALDTEIPRPFPLGISPPPPSLSSPGGSVHLADMDGDGVADRIQCQDHDADPLFGPDNPAWRLQLWRPEAGSTPAGFSLEAEPIDALSHYACNVHLHIVDINSDGKADLLVPSVSTLGGTKEIPLYTYSALGRRSDGSYESYDTLLSVISSGSRVVFVDVNGDGLSDAVESGFSDHRLRTFMNTGSVFREEPVYSFEWDGIGEQDTFFRLASVLDSNGDGRQDLLMPFTAEAIPGGAGALTPSWVILQATGALNGPTFALVDPDIPFEAQIAEAITLVDPRAPRVGDVNNDGAADVVLLLGGLFTIFENRAADQDVLVAISDGLNDHEPDEAGFIPNVSISYGHLSDPWITNGSDPKDPALYTYLYRSHANPANDCIYPRRCAVGPRRVVSSYAFNDGQGGQRHFGVRYRDGRYQRLGGGFLGFGQRIVTDLDTGSGTIELYDTGTSFELGGMTLFPFVGQPLHRWHFAPPLPAQPKPGPIELAFIDIVPSFAPSNDDKTYFTIPTERRLRRMQGVYPPPQDPTQSIEAYVKDVEASGGATLLSDATAKGLKFDAFGQALSMDVYTPGVDLTYHVEREIKNDLDRWVLGQLQSQKECSSASLLSLCRTITRTTTIYGEVETESTKTDDDSPQTKLSLVYKRDDFGNIWQAIADDAFGHHRVHTTVYDDEGIYPTTLTNAVGHITTTFDSGLGVLTKLIDVNGLVTEWDYDDFARPTFERRPDGSQTTITRTRTKDGGAAKNAWRVIERTTTEGGADDSTEFDMLGRPVRLLSHVADTPEQPGSPPRLMQLIRYDHLSGKVAERSVPTREDTADDKLLVDAYEYDALSREVLHRTPWNTTIKTSYAGSAVESTDALGRVTRADNDKLGRPITITDAKKGTTGYTYGPFDTLYTATAPGGAVTRTTRDAFGRVWKLEEPDRGTTLQIHDGFGELISTTDALNRKATYGYDEEGRLVSRIDQKGAEVVTSSWTWDTAPNGVGKLHKATSPDGEKEYAYSSRGQLKGLTLLVSGESEALSLGFSYDPVGRLDTIAYPSPSGAPPFVVGREYDAHGFVRKVKDSVTGDSYWRLTEVDQAGRYQKEVFGNNAVTTRSYFADKQRLKSITTQRGLASIQDLSYEWDVFRNLSSRSDTLQPQHTTERFRYDELHRIRCAYFSVNEDPQAPCALSYDFAPNGNMTFKSDVGALTYGDPAHPHAVKSAGGESYGYDAVGNQTTRPGGLVLSYTPFDLPNVITQGASTTTLGYDADQQRIRKSTPSEETLYLGDLYERVTEMASAITEHRYYVRSPERIVAVVTRGGKKPGTRYLHVDHLGSIDALTDGSGAFLERRSYDPFGKRRSEIWGQPPPASFSSKTTKGFTGHESDEEFGIINMKGRLFDPRLGRFLSTDPIVANLYSGQSFNAYSYVGGNPLTYVDPTGFQAAGAEEPQVIWHSAEVPDGEYGSRLIRWYEVVDPKRGGDTTSRSEIADELGAATPSTDVDTTGSPPGPIDLPPMSESSSDWTQNPYAQTMGGGIAGLGLGAVPFAGFAYQVATTARWMESPSPEFQFAESFAEAGMGLFMILGGVTGEFFGGALTVTQIGAVFGVPTMAVSLTLITSGVANVAGGLHGMANAMMSQGSGGSSAKGAAESRVKLRQRTRAEIEANQPRNADGELIDPNTQQPLKHNEIDVGHKSGQEWRTRQKAHRENGATRSEVIESENDPSLYQLEDRTVNRSHKYEKK